MFRGLPRILGAVIVLTTVAFTHGAISATFVDSALTTSSAASGGAQFDSASVTIYIDPAFTQWIAWNDTTTVLRTHASRPGEFFFGPGGIGVDDFLRLSVVNLQTSQTLTGDIDQNDGFAVSSGTQNLIFGASATAPDAIRDPGGFPGPVQFLDDAPSHSSIFTGAGNYRFDFSFRNVYGSSAAHPDVWVLVSTVPEPGLTSLAVLTTLLFIRRVTK